MSRLYEFTLASNKSIDTSPHNTNYDFLNTLPTMLSLQDYEVALQSIRYTDNFETEPAKVQKPFFDDSSREFEDEISVDSTQSVIVSAYKLDNHLDRFLSKLNADVMRSDIGLQFSFVTERGVIVGVNAICNPPERHNIAIFGSLAKIMGFQEGVPLPAGNSSNSADIDRKLFEDLEFGIAGRIIQAHYKKERFHLENYQRTPTIDTVLADIVLLLSENDYEANLHYNPRTKSLDYDIRKRDVYIHLSTFLKTWMGCPLNQILFDSGSIILNPEAAAFRSEPVPKEPSNLLFVVCDAIEHDYFGSKALPYLACIDRMPGNWDKFFRPNNLVYKGLQDNKLSSVRIQLQDGNGDYIPLSNTPTIVSLLFRPRW